MVTCRVEVMSEGTASSARVVARSSSRAGPSRPSKRTAPSALTVAVQRVTIPMWVTMSSLNVAVAASLLLYEIGRRESATAGATESS